MVGVRGLKNSGFRDQRLGVQGSGVQGVRSYTPLTHVRANRFKFRSYGPVP